MDNRRLSLKELSVLRTKAVEAVIVGKITQKKACSLFGFSPTSMCKYIKEYKNNNNQPIEYKSRGIKAGTLDKMTGIQQDELVATIITHTPDEVGLSYTLWNSKVVQDYIAIKYGVTYHRRSVRKLMRRLGFSSQKPIKLAYERDAQKIEVWLQETYPRIKVRAMTEGARIYWGDEMGYQSTDNRGRTYGLVGQTPVIKKTGTRFKCNMLAAISPQGFMNWMVFNDNFTSDKFITFMGRLMRQVKQKIFLIVDNHQAHHSKKVSAYVAKHAEKIELFYLPPYCPDMNPQELVNQDVKANAGNFRRVKTIDDLTTNLRYYLTKVQSDIFKIMKFFTKPSVAYAA